MPCPLRGKFYFPPTVEECFLSCGTGKSCLLYAVEFYFPSTVEEWVFMLGDRGNNASPSCRDVSFRSTFKTYFRVGDRGRPSRTFVDGYLLPIYCLSIAYLLPILLPIYCLSYVLQHLASSCSKRRNLRFYYLNGRRRQML